MPEKQSIGKTIAFPYHALKDESDLDALMNAVGDARIVLLGESSHGSSEYYQWRAAISKKLITEKGFDFVAVEGDWGDMMQLNDFIEGKHYESVQQVMHSFRRWPQWLWANKDFAGFMQWMQQSNVQDGKKTGVYGLDVFAFTTAINELKLLLPDTMVIHDAEQCFTRLGNDAITYSKEVMKSRTDCKRFTEKIWQQALKLTAGKIRNKNDFQILQNAALLRDGELYFRGRNTDDANSWNGREMHMHQTIKRLLEYYGNDSKGIVWAHNTHVGDAHYTDMSNRRRTNIGETLRREYGENKVFIVGFGSYSGEVMAAESWGAPPKPIKLNNAKIGSWEALLHEDAPVDKILFTKNFKSTSSLNKWVPQRAIGVVYSETYIPSIISRRYDAFIYFEKTKALHLLE